MMGKKKKSMYSSCYMKELGVGGWRILNSPDTVKFHFALKVIREGGSCSLLPSGSPHEIIKKITFWMSTDFLSLP